MEGTPTFVILVTFFQDFANFGRKPKWSVRSIGTTFLGWDWKFVVEKMSYGRKLNMWRGQKCERAVTFRPGNYIWRFSYCFGFVVKDLEEWRPGLYSEFRYASREHSGLPWGAIFRNVLILSLIPSSHAHFSRNKFPKCVLFVCAAPRKEHINISYIFTGPRNGLFPVFPGFRILKTVHFPIFSNSQPHDDQIKNNTLF